MFTIPNHARCVNSWVYKMTCFQPELGNSQLSKNKERYKTDWGITSYIYIYNYIYTNIDPKSITQIQSNTVVHQKHQIPTIIHIYNTYITSFSPSLTPPTGAPAQVSSTATQSGLGQRLGQAVLASAQRPPWVLIAARWPEKHSKKPGKMGIPSGVIKHGWKNPRTEWRLFFGQSPISMVHFPFPCLITEGNA